MLGHCYNLISLCVVAAEYKRGQNAIGENAIEGTRGLSVASEEGANAADAYPQTKIMALLVPQLIV